MCSVGRLFFRPSNDSKRTEKSIHLGAIELRKIATDAISMCYPIKDDVDVRSAEIGSCVSVIGVSQQTVTGK